MRVLVTGGLGHIGSRLIRDLARVSNVDAVRILDNLYTQRYCSLFNLPKEMVYEFVEGDIRRVSDVEVASKGADLVVHLAALTDAPSTLSTPELTREINLLGTRNVVRTSIKNGVRKVVFASTTSVYGPSKGTMREDWKRMRPASPYARFKLLGEKEVLKASREGAIEGTVLRLGTIFGTSVGMRFHTAVNKFVFQACMGVPLTVWRDAYDQYRPYLDLTDGTSALEFMMRGGVGNGEGYNVLTINATVRQIIAAIREFVPNLQVKEIVSPILNQTSYHVDDSKIRRLGFRPKGDLRASIEKTVRLFATFARARAGKQ